MTVLRIGVLLVLLVACFACRDARPTETPTSTPGTRPSCGERLREATPAPPSCSSLVADQTFDGFGDQEVSAVQANRSPVRAPGAVSSALFAWDVERGRQLKEIVHDYRASISGALSPDGGTLALGMLDGTVLVWDVASGKRLYTFKEHAGTVYSIAFSPDGKTLASGSNDGTIVLWNLHKGVVQRTLGGHESWVVSLAFSPDGKTLAAGTSEHDLVLWAVRRGKRRRTLEMPTRYVGHLAYSPDGALLAATTAHGSTILWDPAAGTRELEIGGGRVGGIAFSPSANGRAGRRGGLLALSVGRQVLLVGLASLEPVHELTHPCQHDVSSVAFYDETTLAALAMDGSVALWHLAPSSEFCHTWLRLSVPPEETRAARISRTARVSTPDPAAAAPTPGPDVLGSLAYTTRASGGDGTIWLLAGDAPPRSLGAGSIPLISPDGCSVIAKRLTDANPYGHEYVMLDAPTGEMRFVLSNYDLWRLMVYGRDWAPDSQSLALTLGYTIKQRYVSDLWRIDAWDGAAVRLTTSSAGLPNYSPDGRWIATSLAWSPPSLGWAGLWRADGSAGGALFERLYGPANEAWAADGSGLSLAVAAGGVLGRELWWVPASGTGGGEPVQTGYLPDAQYVSWQPGGGRLAYYRANRPQRGGDLPSTHDLHLAYCDGSEDVVVPGPPGLVYGPPQGRGLLGSPWSPDGRWLLTYVPEQNVYLVDTDRLGSPVRLSHTRVHGWLDAEHYLASTVSAGHTSLYACALPESCRLVAQIEGEVADLSYAAQRCSAAMARPARPSPTPKIPVVAEATATPTSTPSPVAPTRAPTPTPAATPVAVGTSAPTPTPYGRAPSPAVQTLGRGRTLHAAAVSADGKTLAVAWGGDIVIYHAETFEELRVLQDWPPADGMDPWISGMWGSNAVRVALSPDGATLAAAYQGRPVSLWDVASGEKTHTLDLPVDEVTGLAFSPDGKRLVIAEIGAVHLWNLSPGAPEPLIRAQAVDGWSVLDDSSARPVRAMGGYYNAAVLWDVAVGERVADFSPHSSDFYTVAISPDGKTLAAAIHDGTVILWDLETGEQGRTLERHHEYGGVLSRLAFSPDGTVLAGGAHYPAGVPLWDVTTGERLPVLAPLARYVTGMAFMPGGGLLVSTRDGGLAVWDLATRTRLRSLGGHTGMLQSVAFSPDGATLISAAGNQLDFWSSTNLLSDGSGDATIVRWDAAMAEPLRTLGDSNVRAISAAVSPDGAWVAFGSREGSVHLWDLAAGDLLHVYEAGAEPICSLTFSPDGRLLAAGSEAGSVALVDLATGRTLRTLAGDRGWVIDVEFSPDSRTLAGGWTRYAITLWDVGTGEIVHHVERPYNPRSGPTLWDLAFSPDGRYLVSTPFSEGLVIWDPETMALVTQPPVDQFVRSLAFSADGRLLAVAGYSGVTLLDTETWRPVHKLDGESGYGGSCVAFAPGGDAVAAGNIDGTVSLWRLP